jgi:hypothetical protein
MRIIMHALRRFDRFCAALGMEHRRRLCDALNRTARRFCRRVSRSSTRSRYQPRANLYERRLHPGLPDRAKSEIESRMFGNLWRSLGESNPCFSLESAREKASTRPPPFANIQ